MDIEIIKKAKLQCESEIRAIVVMFENQSKCVVHGINVLRVETYGRSPGIASVTIDARLE